VSALLFLEKKGKKLEQRQ